MKAYLLVQYSSLLNVLSGLGASTKEGLKDVQKWVSLDTITIRGFVLCISAVRRSVGMSKIARRDVERSLTWSLGCRYSATITPFQAPVTYDASQPSTVLGTVVRLGPKAAFSTKTSRRPISASYLSTNCRTDAKLAKSTIISWAVKPVSSSISATTSSTRRKPPRSRTHLLQPVRHALHFDKRV